MHLPKRTLCLIGWALALGSGISGCRLIDRFASSEPASEVTADAATKASQYAAFVDNGSIRTRSSGKSVWLQEARDQLAYAAGQLTELGGLMDSDRVDIELEEGQIADDGGVTLVPFKAKFPVSWNADLAAPPSLVLFLPKGGDKEARQAFYTAYRDTCADPAATDLALRSFWYHYRPSRPSCDMGKGTFDRSLVTRPTLTLKPITPAAAQASAQAAKTP